MKDKITEILGWEPNKEMLLLILDEMKQGKDVYEACSKYTLPSIHVLTNDEPDPKRRYPGEKMVIIREKSND